MTIDSVAPSTPVVNASNGTALAGTAEAGAKVILFDGNGESIGETTATGGIWSFTPGTPLANGTIVHVVAEDAAGNTSGAVFTVVDALAPATPVVDASNGSVLTGTAEAGAKVILTDGLGNAIGAVTADGSGNWSFTPSTPLANGTIVNAVAQDAVGNTSGPASTTVDTVAPAAPVVDASNGSVLTGTAEAGATVILSAGGSPLGQTTASIAGTWSFTPGIPLANGTVVSAVAQDAAGNTSGPATTAVDSVAPSAPVVDPSFGIIITGTAEAGAKVILTDGNRAVIGETTAGGSGAWSFTPATPLAPGTVVNVVAEDAARNASGASSLTVGAGIDVVTIGNFSLDVSLNPLNPRYAFAGTTGEDASVVIRVITPSLNVELLPIAADASGNFSLNLLSPTVLTQLGLNITDILNLGSQISFQVVATDDGHSSSVYGITTTPNGLSLNIGRIDVNGTSGHDVLSGHSGSAEHINGGDGSDAILNVSTGDHVIAGSGDDIIQITSTDFVSIDGGVGFDTLLLANGIDLDYNAVGVGTLSNIERINLGKGDSGSVLTLTAAEVDAITDGNSTLQITGENNDTLNVVGAVNMSSTQVIDGITYDVYTFGSATLLIQDNTVQVVV